jgi:hypothetical protein
LLRGSGNHARDLGEQGIGCGSLTLAGIGGAYDADADCRNGGAKRIISDGRGDGVAPLRNNLPLCYMIYANVGGMSEVFPQNATTPRVGRRKGGQPG